jgi:ABC-type transport system involved in multi-copper enzyme maturation permease subunit
MMWLAWRQYRAQAAFGLFALIVFAVLFGVTAPHIWHTYDTIVKPCSKYGDCSTVDAAFLTNYNFYEHLIQASVIFPALLGAFWGAPLVAREFENGTFRLTWTQSETRVKWLASKLTVAGLGTVLTVGLFSLMATWWSHPYDIVNRAPFSTFDVRDIAPLGYAAFAFALGVPLGVLIRRTLPAMAATLIVFASVRVFYNLKIRPHLISPLHATSKFLPFSQSNNVGVLSEKGAWIISSTTETSAGVVIGEHGGIGSNGQINFSPPVDGHSTFVGVGRCPNVFPKQPIFPTSGAHRVIIGGPSSAMQKAINECINSFHLTSVLTYQPADRFWTFQWYELACYLVLAGLLSFFSVWLVRRH